jgi:acetyltransferase-like isoleucine patch superfamily enzyme
VTTPVSGPVTVSIDPTAEIAPSAIIGTGFRRLLDGRQPTIDGITVIQAGVWIGPYVTIGQGVRIGTHSVIEECANVQAEVVIGSRVLVAGRSWLGAGAKVGDNSIIKGHIGENSRVGAGCRVAGDLIHRQLDPTIPWDDPGAEEASPIVEDGAFVGWRAVIVGGVNIGAGAYICADALITKDVPAGHIACGRNQIMPPDDWRGDLGKSPFFRSREAGKLHRDGAADVERADA